MKKNLKRNPRSERDHKRAEKGASARRISTEFPREASAKSATKNGAARTRTRKATGSDDKAEPQRIDKGFAVMNGTLYNYVMVTPAATDFIPEELPYWSALSESGRKFLKEDVPTCQRDGWCFLCYPTGRKMKAHPGRGICLFHIKGAYKLPLAYVEVMLRAERARLSAVLAGTTPATTEMVLMWRRQVEKRLHEVERELLECQRFIEGRCVFCGEPLPPLNRGDEEGGGDNLTPGRKPLKFCSAKCRKAYHKERDNEHKRTNPPSARDARLHAQLEAHLEKDRAVLEQHLKAVAPKSAHTKSSR